MNDTVHGLDEFAEFPWDRLEAALFWRTEVPEDEHSSCWQCGGISLGGIVGGHDFNPREPHVDFVRNNPTCHIEVDAWAIPQSLQRFLDEMFSRGAEHARAEIRKAIGAR